MILENHCYNDNDDNFDEKSKRKTKNREMETNTSEFSNPGNFREQQQNLLFSPQVYKHLLSSPLFHSRSHMENKKNETEMVRSCGGSRQYFHSNDIGMKRKYDEEVSSGMMCYY